MMEVSITEFIANTGFPIAVCIYLLWERDKRIKQLTIVMTEMKNMMSVMIQRCA